MGTFSGFPKPQTDLTLPFDLTWFSLLPPSPGFSPLLFNSYSPSLCLEREADLKIFQRTLHLFNRSPQTLQRRSFSPTPPSSPSLNASKTGSPLGDHSRSVSGDFNQLRMAFSGFGNSNPAGGSAQAELGPELSDVFTDVRRALSKLMNQKDIWLISKLGDWLQRYLR